MNIRELLEGPQGGTLYHGTDILSAARILYTDVIKARTDHVTTTSVTKARTDHLTSTGVTKPGVSLTRSFRFAVDWQRAGAILALDGDRLRTRYRLMQIDYFQDRREHEEFLFGSIQPLSHYLTAIFITPETKQYCEEVDDDLIEGHKTYERLLAHPLLKVMKFPSHVRYVNPRQLGAGTFDAKPYGALPS